MHTNLTERDDDRPVLVRLDLAGPALSRVAIELLVTELFDGGATGVEELADPDDDEHGTFALLSGFPNRASALAVLRHLADRPLVVSALVEVPEDTYLDGWRAFARPNRAGRHFIIHPPWLPLSPNDVGDDDLVLPIDPGRSFGSGAHATTRLVLAQLEGLVAPGWSLLDVGCGSGVLAVAAARLGAGAVAVDIDPEAIRATAENLARNGVTATLLTELPEPDGGRFDVVAANIGANTLIGMAPRLCALGRTLALSGFLSDRAEEVAAAYVRLGAREVDRLIESIETSHEHSSSEPGSGGHGWVALTMVTE